jgi:hypothetical protein
MGVELKFYAATEAALPDFTSAVSGPIREGREEEQSDWCCLKLQTLRAAGTRSTTHQTLDGGRS